MPGRIERFALGVKLGDAGLLEGRIQQPQRRALTFQQRLDIGPSRGIGAIRGGDLYNRIAIEARIDGTLREPPFLPFAS